MKYNDWQKPPNSEMWRRDPSSMRFIGRNGTNTTYSSSITPKMTPRRGEIVEGPLGKEVKSLDSRIRHCAAPGLAAAEVTATSSATLASASPKSLVDCIFASSAGMSGRA